MHCALPSGIEATRLISRTETSAMQRKRRKTTRNKQKITYQEKIQYLSLNKHLKFELPNA